MDFARAWVELSMARRLRRDGRDAEAAGLLDDAIGRLEGPVAEADDIWQYRTTLAAARSARAELAERDGRLEAAEADAREALETLGTLASRLGAVAEAWSPLADASVTLARIAARRGDPGGAEARDLLASALEARRRAVDARPDDPALRDRLEADRALLGALGDATEAPDPGGDGGATGPRRRPRPQAVTRSSGLVRVGPIDPPGHPRW